ncbi:protein-lysine methyltransferase METTL21C [Impatiens glandulifera]|uniref:protein-lysine methyltransferase METTL21C n=1 Tax=Impatiens glandulifera TaxID=253017 RepID=UPI001FB08E90|nr:protein-lysine methyltransferase METTL21C [Impatiens glandulifera]
MDNNPEEDEVASLSALFPSTSSDEDDDGEIVISAQQFPSVQLHDEPVEQLDIYPLSSIDATVVIRQLRSLGISFQLWPAATSFVNLLNQHHSNPTTSPLASSVEISSGRQLRILELGSGTGLAGIAMAAVLKADVTVTELPHVIENLQYNVEANSEMVTKHGGSIVAAALAWGEIDHMETVGRDFDLIIASDVVYHNHLYDPLIQTLRYLLIGCDEGKERKPLKFVMAHLKRWKKESCFFKKARKLFDVAIIHSDSPLDRSRRGVSFYQFTRKQA